MESHSSEGSSVAAIPSSDYYISGNTRHVKPYIFEFSTYAKGRWLNRQLLDVVCAEFGGLGYNRQFWKNAISDGHIKINNKIVSENYVLKNSDYLTRRTHRHEPPVYGQVVVVGENKDLFAVSKPASLPMHPCGAYFNNSLSQILVKEFQPQLKGTVLHQIHRLDRVTSGLVVMAKNKQAARVMCDQIQSRYTRKSYLARVNGKFPHSLEKLRDFSQCGSVIMGAETDACNTAAANLSVQRLIELVSEDNVLVQQANSYKSTSSKHDNSNVAGNTKAGTKRKIDDMDKNSDKGADVPAHQSQIPTGYKFCSPEEIAGYAPLIARMHQQCNPDDTSLPCTMCVQVPLVTVSHKEGIHAADLSGASCCCFQAAVDKTVEGTENLCAGNGCSSSSSDNNGSSSDNAKNASVTSTLMQAKPQYAISLFTSVGYDPVSDTSLVLCSPVTGRTHQLRIHLQVLGNPISNDVCYGGELFAHEEGGKVEAALAAYKLHQDRGAVNTVAIPHIEALWRKYGGSTDVDIMTETDAKFKVAAASGNQDVALMATAGGGHNRALLNAFTALGNSDVPAIGVKGNSSHMQLAGDINPYLDRRQADETEDEHIIRTCSYCRESEALELHQSMHCDGVYLHAFCYETDDWSFETPWPEWSLVFRKGNVSHVTD